MDWGFLDIFKKAEFNSLMLSIAISGGIMYYYHIDSIIFGLFSVASIYCMIRFVVYCYVTIVAHIATKNYEAQKKRDKELKDKAYEDNRRIEISRMFEGLSDHNKFILTSILINGKKDSYYYNVLNFPKYGKDASNIFMAQDISMIYRTEIGGGQYCIHRKEYTDTICVTIDPILYEIIAKYIEENKSNAS